MPIGIGLAIAGATGLAGSLISANAAKSAAQTQADANAAAQQQLLATGAQASQQFTPYTGLGQTGVNYLNQALPALTTAPSVYTPQANYQNFTNADLNAQLAPNYAFQLQQGQGATNAAANATGGMVGGNALQGLENYTQNYAQNAYQNALSNYMNQYQLGLSSNMSQQQQAYNQATANQTNIYNRLAGIAGIGMQGATGAANAQLGTGSNIAQLTQGIGQATAAGQVGAANAISGGLSNLGNLAFLSNLYGGSTPASTSSGSGLYQLGQGYSGSGSNYLTSLGG
jgi:hypothetical protein